MNLFRDVPLDARIVVYELASEIPIIHYTPKFWVDTSVSSGRWLPAAKVGDLDALQALLEYNQHRMESLSDEDQRMEERKFKTVHICRYLARGGYLKALQWAHNQNFPMDEMTFVSAAMGGNLLTLQWLREVRCPWNCLLCSSAAEIGHLHVLQWLHADGFPWDTQTFTAAVGYGDVNILQWLLNHGCPWDNEAYKMAKKNKRWDIADWLAEQDLYRQMEYESESLVSSLLSI